MARDGLPNNVRRMVGLAPENDRLSDDEPRYGVTAISYNFASTTVPYGGPTQAGLTAR